MFLPSSSFDVLGSGGVFLCAGLVVVLNFYRPHSPVCSAMAWGTLGVALLSGRVGLYQPAFYALVVCGICFAMLPKVDKTWHTLPFLLAFCLGFVLMKHWVAGVTNLCLLNAVTLSVHTAPFSLWLNWDKPLIGAWALMAVTPSVKLHRFSRVPYLGSTVGFLCVGVGSLMVLACSMGYVAWDPKIPSFWPLWSLVNGLLVVLPEEAFFRGFLQRELCQKCEDWGISWRWGWLGASLLFGLFHAPAPLPYLLLSTVAGLFYGGVFHQTRRLGSSLLVHFGVNAVHFFCFSYPHLAPPA